MTVFINPNKHIPERVVDIIHSTKVLGTNNDNDIDLNEFNVLGTVQYQGYDIVVYSKPNSVIYNDPIDYTNYSYRFSHILEQYGKGVIKDVSFLV